MSDAVATSAPAGGGSSQATPSTPANTNATQAPAQGATTTAAPTKPPDFRSELDAMLKKAGGFKTKAAGRERVIDSAEQLERLIQRGLPIEDSLQEIAKEKAALAPKAKLLAQLESDNEEEVEKAIEQLLGSKLDRVSERRVMRQIQREEALKDHTPRERELMQSLEAERAERMRLANETKAQQAQAQQRAEAAKTREYMDSMANTAGAALKMLDLPEALHPMALNVMNPILSAAIDAGVPVSPEVVSQKVESVLSGILTWAMKSKTEAGLQKMFGSDFDKKYRKALLAALPGQNGTQQPPAQQQSSQSSTEPGVSGFHLRRSW